MKNQWGEFNPISGNKGATLNAESPFRGRDKKNYFSSYEIEKWKRERVR